MRSSGSACLKVLWWNVLFFCFFLAVTNKEMQVMRKEWRKERRKATAAVAATTTRAAPPMYDGAVCSWIRTGACLLAFLLCFCATIIDLLDPGGSLEPPVPRKDPPNPLSVCGCARAHLMRDPKSALTSSDWCHEALVWFCVEQDCMNFHVLHVLHVLQY